MYKRLLLVMETVSPIARNAHPMVFMFHSLDPHFVP